MPDKYEKDAEFLEKARFITDTPEFQGMKATQHHNDSIFNHTLRVAYLAYRLGHKTGANESELLRGALLHDFYLYNWRDKDRIVSHGWMHPRIALENARRLFSPITEREENIIFSHMWPFNPRTLPRFKESLIVSFSDKAVATGEIIVMFFNFIGRIFQKILAR